MNADDEDIYYQEMYRIPKIENLEQCTKLKILSLRKNLLKKIEGLDECTELVELDLTEELSKGERIAEMQDLFTSDTVDAGQAAYRWFEARFTLSKIAVVAAILFLIAGVVVFVIRRLRT